MRLNVEYMGMFAHDFTPRSNNKEITIKLITTATMEHGKLPMYIVTNF